MEDIPPLNFLIKALIDRIVGAWKLKLGKNITRHYLPIKGFKNVISFICHTILVNELLRKKSSYYFYAANKASESFVPAAVCMLLLSSETFSLWLLILTTNI